MDSGSPTESTALLGTSENRATRPFIEDGITLIKSLGLTPQDGSSGTSALFLDAFPGAPAAHTAYHLLTLLQYRLFLQQQLKITSRDIWTRHDHQLKASLVIQDIERQVNSVWEDFTSNYRSSEEIEVALWTEFPQKPGGPNARGIQLLLSLFPPL